MNYSGIPAKTTVTFAVSGTKNVIANTSTTATLAAGTATYDVGFPPLTMTALDAGGKPPSGGDFNGIFYNITKKQQWSDAGMSYPYDAAFSTAVSGYPLGSYVPSSDLLGFWLNTTDANTATPENTNASLTGWVPGEVYGVTSVTGLSNANVTLTALQAAKSRIVLTGLLTANIYLYFPAWIKKWTIVNNCTGPYSVMCKTLTGAGVNVGAGGTSSIVCDGANILTDSLLVSNNLLEIYLAGATSQALALVNIGLGTYGGFRQDIGAANALAVTATGETLITGMSVNVLVAHTTTSSTVTLNFNGAGAISVYRLNGALPAIGDFIVGHCYTFIYNGSTWDASPAWRTPANAAQTISSTQNVTVPPWSTACEVEMWAGGGGGGGTYGPNSTGGGGGEGGYVKLTITGLTPLSAILAKIGGGGTAGGDTPLTAGGVGGTTSFGSYASATGGGGGGVGNSAQATVEGAGGSGSITSGVGYALSGKPGALPWGVSGTWEMMGIGGNNTFQVASSTTAVTGNSGYKTAVGANGGNYGGVGGVGYQGLISLRWLP